MLKNCLQEHFENNKLYNSWIIQSHDLAKVLHELKEFIRENLLPGKVQLENHPDFKMVEKLKTGAGSKNINIEQIRALQEFLNKTAGISNYKVAIIYQADLMNQNAANSCLKILEDTPKNTYIFLITSNSSMILPTIGSRCVKFEIYNENQTLVTNNYEEYIALLLTKNVREKLNFFKELSDKNKNVWLDFTNTCIEFSSKITKKSIGIEVLLNENENKVLEQLKSTSVTHLIKKFESLNKLINNTNDYDLEPKASFILIANLFES